MDYLFYNQWGKEKWKQLFLRCYIGKAEKWRGIISLEEPQSRDELFSVTNTHAVNKYLLLFSDCDEVVKTVCKMRFSERPWDIRILNPIAFQRKCSTCLLGHFESSSIRNMWYPRRDVAYGSEHSPGQSLSATPGKTVSVILSNYHDFSSLRLSLPYP